MASSAYAAGDAPLYRYVDDDGIATYTTALDDVPDAYKNRVQVVDMDEVRHPNPRPVPRATATEDKPAPAPAVRLPQGSGSVEGAAEVPLWAGLAFGALLFAFALWLSIKLVERYNEQNTLVNAMFLGAVFALCGVVPSVYVFAVPLLMLLLLTIHLYDLTMIKGFGVVAAMAAMCWNVWYLVGEIWTAIG